MACGELKCLINAGLKLKPLIQDQHLHPFVHLGIVSSKVKGWSGLTEPGAFDEPDTDPVSGNKNQPAWLSSQLLALLIYLSGELLRPRETRSSTPFRISKFHAAFST